jgi:UDPglucose 6-dehydrogenase
MSAVSVFGLGKVGHTLACCLAAAGNRVIGVDPVRELVDAINDGTFQSAEPGIAERLARAGSGTFTATCSPEEAVAATDVTMVIVPTPSNTLGGFSLRFVINAVRTAGEGIRRKDGRHTVAVVSTVLPGASNRYIVPALEEASGRKIGAGLGYCYNPSFIALGEVVNGFEHPDYVLIGEVDEESGDALAAVHQSMLRNDTPIARMRPIEAEIAKIASNTHETMRVAFANMLFGLCSEVPDADVDRITGALAYRMGQRFFKGAVPYGGPCWPRDNRALSVFMDAVGVPSLMPRTIDLSNDEHGRYILRKVLEATDRDETVGLLGLAYKPGTNVVERAFGLDLANWLVTDGRRVIGWDPLAMSAAKLHLNGAVTYAANPEACLRASKTVVIVNPLREFATVDWSAAAHATVMDPWRCLAPAATKQVGKYVAMGRGNGEAMRFWLADELGEKLRLLNS